METRIVEIEGIRCWHTTIEDREEIEPVEMQPREFFLYREGGRGNWRLESVKAYWRGDRNLFEIQVSSVVYRTPQAALRKMKSLYRQTELRRGKYAEIRRLSKDAGGYAEEPSAQTNH